MKLHHPAASPNSRRVRIFLAEKGLSIPLVTVDLGKGEQLGWPALLRRRYHCLVTVDFAAKAINFPVPDEHPTGEITRPPSASGRPTTFSTAPTSSRAARVSSTSSRVLRRPSNMSRAWSWPKATLSSSTDDSLALDSRKTGLPPTSYASPTGSWPNTGTYSRMRRLRQSRRAVCQCSAIALPIDRGNTQRRFLDAQLPFPIQKDTDHGRQTDQDSGARSPDFGRTEPVSRRSHGGRKNYRGHQRCVDASRGVLSTRSVYPLSGCRYGHVHA